MLKMAHNFQRFPELTNSQMDIYYFESPHKQIFEDFQAEVVKVIDGDTITVRVNFRDFDFPVRFIGTNAPEMSEGGQESKDWLSDRIEGELIDIRMDRRNRVGRFGRLLGKIFHLGMNINEESINTGHAVPFERKDEGKLPDLNRELLIEKWL